MLKIFRKIIEPYADKVLDETTRDLDEILDRVHEYIFYEDSDLLDSDMCIIRTTYSKGYTVDVYKFASEKAKTRFDTALVRLKNLVDPFRERTEKGRVLR
ncbi:hypothetical protein J4462_03590 [Candidatus Pacearchaeota archaeon]|nr:hypothetical protein [Candidatus Pacearchaeota archaeon]